MDERQRRRALATLQRVYQDIAERAVDTVIENKEGLEQSPYSFAYQEIEDRYAPRLMNLGNLIGALQHLGRREEPPTRYRVERVEGELEELDEVINTYLALHPGDALHNVQFIRGEGESEGSWHAFLTVSRQE
jgi:hypothetical protein